jgi:hypothetical protein
MEQTVVSPSTTSATDLKELQATLASYKQHLAENTEALNRMTARVAVLEAGAKPSTVKLVETFGEAPLTTLEAGLQGAKTVKGTRAAYEKFIADTDAMVKANFGLDGVARPVKILDKRTVILTALGAAIGAAGLGAAASAYAYKRGQDAGAQAVVDSKLRAWKNGDSELHLEMNGTDGKGVHMTIEETPHPVAAE